MYGLLGEVEQREVRDRVARSKGIDPAKEYDAAFEALSHATDEELDRALRAWWHEDASVRRMLWWIDRHDERSLELAALLVAVRLAYRSTDPRVAECRRVRLAWARGEATREQRQDAMGAIFGLTIDAWGDVDARSAARAATAVTWDAIAQEAEKWEGNTAGVLRENFEDPLRISADVVLSRWVENECIEAVLDLKRAFAAAWDRAEWAEVGIVSAVPTPSQWRCAIASVALRAISRRAEVAWAALSGELAALAESQDHRNLFGYSKSLYATIDRKAPRGQDRLFFESVARCLELLSIFVSSVPLRDLPDCEPSIDRSFWQDIFRAVVSSTAPLEAQRDAARALAQDLVALLAAPSREERS